MTAILIVDDSLTVRMDLADALEAVGLVPVPCASLAEAREAIRTWSIALAILDVRLPDGDGVAFLHELRANPAFAALPVLMLSSEAEVSDRIRGLKTGASDYVGKPYDTDFVIARIRALVGADRITTRMVLVIDDSTTFRESLAETLERSGYDAVTAASGLEGLRLAAANRPGAIIVDGVMPDMTGDLVIRRIRLDPALRTIPCLLLTGSDDAAAEIHALDAGADAFARKEADLDVILARFGAMLRTARGLQSEDATSLLAPRRILAVDDSPTYLHAIAEQLQEGGYDVVQATSGEQAIELLAVQPVDCILLDLVMPGLSGIETCRRIKAAPTLRDVPLIALTSHDGRDAMIEVLAAGADDFVSKASGSDVLAARVKAQIRRKQFTDEHRRVRERLLRSEHEAAEARAAHKLSETRAVLADELARTNQDLAAANRELEAFSYSVSHDLRAPLRAIRSFTQMLDEDAADKLDVQSRDHLRRILAATGRMRDLIDALLELSRIGRAELGRIRVDLGAVATSVLDELRARDPSRLVEVTIERGLTVDADPRMARALFDNLLGNAWKFTSAREHAHITVGVRETESIRGVERTFFVRDDGAGFDMARASNLFVPFQRLHGSEFPGTGIGLATVRRIVERHRGRIWAESSAGTGTTILFTLPS